MFYPNAIALLALMSAPAVAGDMVLLHAAGSLRGALTDIAKGFEAESGAKVQAKFGASGLLKDEIAGGAKAEVFASANGTLVAQGAADIFLTYCTNAQAAQKENPDQQIVALPDALAVGADYGLTVMNDTSASAYKFAMFILSAEGQRVLANHGFAAPGLPQ